MLKMEKTFAILTISLTLLLALGSATVTQFGKLLGELTGNAHDVAGTIYVIDSKTIWVRGFSYDGTAPDAFFYGGDSPNPSSSGVIIPDESGTTIKLGLYENENLILTLPEGKTINSFRWISIWCRQVGADFGHVVVEENFVAPASVSLGELETRAHEVYASEVIVLNTRQFKFVDLVYDGKGPAAFFWVDQGDRPTTAGKRIPHEDEIRGPKLPKYTGQTVIVTLPKGTSVDDYGNIGLWCEAARQNFGHVIIRKPLLVPPYIGGDILRMDHCKVLKENRFHIAWKVDEANDKITLQFIGSVNIREYMAFGISGSDTATKMLNSDVTVVYIDSDNKPVAEDYFLNKYAQCTPNNGFGACPDILQGGTEDVVLIEGVIRNGITRITVERSLNSSDTLRDKPIPVDAPVFISWGIGDINPTNHVSKHDFRTIGNIEIDFGDGTSSCPNLIAPSSDPDFKAWKIEPLMLEPGSVVTAQIGPSGGSQGYKGIAGQVGWGISWYLNGQLIPEIHVVRNATYTFMVYGGNNMDNLARHHPFYITDDKDGGYTQKPIKEQEKETIYAEPEAGDLCEYMESKNPDDYSTFEEFKTTLTLDCPSSSTPGKLTWFVEETTPDIVYYQCYQHRYFGFRIIVSGSSLLVYQLPLTLLLIFVAIFNLS